MGVGAWFHDLQSHCYEVPALIAVERQRPVSISHKTQKIRFSCCGLVTRIGDLGICPVHRLVNIESAVIESYSVGKQSPVYLVLANTPLNNNPVIAYTSIHLANLSSSASSGMIAL